MINRWLKDVVIVALMAVGTVSAQAADLPSGKEAPAPVFIQAPFTWTGFYIGVNAGGIWSSGSRDASILDPDAAFDGGFLTSAVSGQPRIGRHRLHRRRPGRLQLADWSLRARRRNRL